MASKKEAEVKFAEGDRVTIVQSTPEGRPVKGVVRVLNDAKDDPGHQVGVELDDYVVYGHSLDGVVDEREQGGDLPVVGKGWWSRPEYLVKDEA